MFNIHREIFQVDNIILPMYHYIGATNWLNERKCGQDQQ